MKKSSILSICQQHCKHTKLYGLYLCFELSEEVPLAAPYLNFLDDGQLLIDGQCLITDESISVIENLFAQTVGDEGPTKWNSYSGNSRVYALIIDKNGDFLTDNT